MTPIAERTPPVAAVAARLAEGGFVAADDEARRLVDRAGADSALLESLLVRRLDGEPLAWLVGHIQFLGCTVRVAPGVYVPRLQSEPLAARAIERLPEAGTAIDLCTGAGAVAMALRSARPRARVLATDISAAAVECARSNGVEAVVGDLFQSLPPALVGTVDVVVGVPPYVPTGQLPRLHRDALRFEPLVAYDGGSDGLSLVRRAVADAARWLRPGGALLLEAGGDQAEALVADLAPHGFGDVRPMEDDEGDLRGIEATFAPDAGRSA